MLSLSSLAWGDAEEDYKLGAERIDNGDMVSALPHLRKAVEAGHIKAMAKLAQILDISDFDEDAIELYRKAADKGDADAMFGLGAMLIAGEGVKERQPVEGFAWVRKAAELGQGQAINAMAQTYLKAELGLTEADRNTPEALRWVKEAAKQDYLPAVDALVEAYKTGASLGVSADPTMAAEYEAQGNKIRKIEPTKGKKKKKTTAS